ncbi:hypothetical protein NKI12_21240 [Mesorhizobium australicum]|uniref:Uncharacterized protein n=1 Tax=Mesorhizobium australicum TaxID=536018 RepID=A0ACC6T2Q4_9HYPH
MTDRPDTLAAAMFGNSPFPESSEPAKGSSAWADFRAKQSGATWDDAIAKVNAEMGYHAPAPTARSASADAGWSAPAASPTPAAPHGGINAGSSEGYPVSNLMSRFSNPAMIAEKLPGLGAERYRTLTEKKAEWFLLGRAVQDTINEKVLERQKINIRLREIERDTNSQKLDENREYQNFQSKLADLTAEIERLEQRRDPWISKANVVGRLINTLDRYLGETPIAALQAWSVPIKAVKADTIPAVLDRLAGLRADLVDVDTRPWPAADAKRRALEEIEYLALKGTVAVSKSIDYRNQLGWPLASADVVLRGYGKRDAQGRPDLYNEHTVSPDVALTVWLFKDQVTARIMAELDEFANEERALSEEQRASMTARVNGSLLAEQRLLSQLIWAGDLHDQWPDDIDPRAVLGIDGPEPRQD